MPENKSKFLVPAIGAGVVVIGGIAAYMLFLKGPAGDATGALASAKMVPDEAMMATYITTDPQAWQKLEQFGTPEARKLITDGLKEFNKSSLETNNITYDKDIKPWIGGVMVAMIPPSAAQPAQNSPSANASQPGTLAIIGIRDKVEALKLATRIKEDKTVQSKEIDYKGEKITESKGKGSTTYTAILNNNSYIIFSDNQKIVQQSIDTFKGEPSFASKPGAQEILNNGAKVENAIAQIYVPDYAGMVETIVKSSPSSTPLPPQSLEQLKQIRSMVAGVGIDDAGVRMKANVNLAPNFPFRYENSPGNIVSQFPGDTFAMVAGNGINRWWEAMQTQSKDIPEIKTAIDSVRNGAKQAANIDLDKEVFGWMDGEFGLAAIPSNQGILASSGFGGALVFDTKDRKTAESALAKLDQFMKAQSPGINIAKSNANGKEVTEWQAPGGQGSIMSHGWIDQDTVFIALGGKPIADVITNNQNNLASSESFKSITSSLQKPNSGYFFLDMDKTMTLVNTFASRGAAIDPQAKAILDSIDGVAMTTSSPNQSTSQVEMLLALKKTK